MERTSKTLRKSIHIFLKNYHFFTTTPSLIALPFSISILLFQFLLPSNYSFLLSIQNYLIPLFHVARFPPYFTLLILKLSQSITSSVLVLPFTFFSLLVSKSLTLHFLENDQKALSTSIWNTYTSILATQLCNIFLIITVNSTCFAFLFMSFSLLDGLGFSSPNSRLMISFVGAVSYSIIFANTLVISNLALISSGVEQNGGYLAILKACFLISGRKATALALAISMNVTLAAVEWLFRNRVTRVYYESRKFEFSMVMEGIFIVYLYTIVFVVDTIASYVFFKSCKIAYRLENARRYNLWLEYEELSIGHNPENAKVFEEFP